MRKMTDGLKVSGRRNAEGDGRAEGRTCATLDRRRRAAMGRNFAPPLPGKRKRDRLSSGQSM